MTRFRALADGDVEAIVRPSDLMATPESQGVLTSIAKWTVELRSAPEH